MIYDDARSVFVSLGGTLRALGEALGATSLVAGGAGFRQESTALLGIAGLAHGAAGEADGSATMVASQGPMRLLTVWARLRIEDLRDNWVAYIRAGFDAASAPTPASGDRARAGELLADVEQRLSEALSAFEETGIFPEGPAYNLGRLRDTVDDIASYPVLTTEIPATGPAGSAVATSVGVRRQVDLAVREVLGRLPRYTDATAFTAALNATFDVRSEQGHTVVTWRPRGFLGAGQLGGTVSGAQGSLYARATDALGSALPVLAGLVALRPDADTQEMDAARAVVESEFRAVVDELGTPGGPRAARVDGLFSILLDETVTGIDSAQVPGGMVGYLGAVFGLERGQVNTLEEEQVFSNYLLLRDYVEGLRGSWTNFNNAFQQKDLGTLLVLLSNALQVVAESVLEVESAMDSVFVGSAERSVARFPTGGGRHMLVSELFSWITSFASAEAPELVLQGGRRSMGAVESTSSSLIGLVARLQSAMAADPGLPSGMRHPRVRHPLDELRTYLGQVVQLAADVRSLPAA